jgi:hypothetical protein
MAPDAEEPRSRPEASIESTAKAASMTTAPARRYRSEHTAQRSVMSTIKMHATTIATPEQYTAGLTESDPVGRRSSATAPTAT